MRLLLSFAAVAVLLTPFATAAQDPGAMATQQAIQANMQAMQAAQQANEQAMQANQQAVQAAQSQAVADAASAAATPCCYGITATPKFSVKPGIYDSAQTVRISDGSRGAVIYYTTDGWTPTPASRRYVGPITIDANTTLQAVAFSPYYSRSLVAGAHYEISTTPANAQLAPKVPIAPGQAAPVELEFAADVSSQTAQIGDVIPMTLAQDFVYGNTVVKQGATADVTITAVDKNGIGGLPGVLTFAAGSLQTGGGPVPMLGGATREGTAKPPGANAMIPIYGSFTVFKHGDPAIIAKGTPFTAYIDPNVLSASAQPQPQQQ
jgi:Chitobiase/beta-hexosaminidase C-terminal domain